MSQVVSIRRVKHEGAAVYLGEVEGVDTWSRNPEKIMVWMCDGYRTRFNQHRSKRKKYLSIDGEYVLDVASERILVPIGTGEVIDITDAQARERFSYMAALPVLLLQHPERAEGDEWWQAVNRRKTLASRGRATGRMPTFRSSKQGDLRFAAWYNSGRNTVLRRTGKRSGVLTITGQNPAAYKGSQKGQRWSIKISVRLSEDIRPYTSAEVDWKKQTVTFISMPKELDLPTTGRAVGLDRGVTHAVASSDGQFFDMPSVAEHEAKRKFHQKRMSKSRVMAAKEGRNFWESGGYQEHKRLAAKASEKIASIRNDFQHKLTTDLVETYDTLVFEALNVKGMTKAAKGKGRAAKRGLNRGILNVGWSTIQRMAEYKAKAAGPHKTVATVNPAYTSQRCPKCTHIAPENRESQAVFKCVKCGFTANADVVGGVNILDRFMTGWTSPGWSKGKTSGGPRVTAGSCDEVKTAALP